MYDVFSDLLKKNGVKVADVSRATGIPKPTFTAWKKGKLTPKADKMQKIADFFNVPVEYLMTGEEHILEQSILFDSLLENPELYDAVKLMASQDTEKQKKIIEVIRVMCE